MIAVFRVLLFASALLFAPAALAQGEDIRRVEKGIERLEEQGKRRDEKIEALTANMAELSENMAVLAERMAALTEKVDRQETRMDGMQNSLDRLYHTIIIGLLGIIAATFGAGWWLNRKPSPAAPAAESRALSDSPPANPNLLIVTEDIVSAALARHFRENSSREITSKRVQ